MIKRAIDRGLVQLNIHNIRDFAHDKHRTVDDYPYGGGCGMVLKPEPLFEAVEAVRERVPGESFSVVLLSPQGRLFSHKVAKEISKHSNVILICGHYEGVDERVRAVITDEISIGDYVLTGGELAAMVVVDAVVRLLPGMLRSETAVQEESHARGLLEYPQYTRPQNYRGYEVPAILLSGNHQEISRWRGEQAFKRTRERRPDLLEKAVLWKDKEACE